ncbi:MAG: 3'(2'),5'-bisphosphate nucleotidase CysQ [Saprospiraceae bacterium]
MLQLVDVGVVKDILITAGKTIMDIYRSDDFGTTIKKDDTPVTAADLSSNEYITKCLKQYYPEIPIISEEVAIPPYSLRAKYEYVWLLDPLDGTKEFVDKTDEFCINLALIHHGVPIMGFIYLPAFQALYYAIQGKGAYEIKDQYTTKLKVSTYSPDESGIRVAASRSYMDDETQSYIDVLSKPKIIRLGSALKFVSIAKGDTDYYPRMIHIREWDIAAGQVIIEEAGGQLTDAHTGQPLTYNKDTMVTPHFIASGQTQLHEVHL